MSRAISEPAKLALGLSKNPQLSAEISKDMLKFGAGIATILAMTKAAGGSVNLDPRSNEFGKAKAGSMMVDLTGGFAPWLQFLAREAPETLRNAGLPVSGYPPQGKRQKPGVKMDIFTRFLASRVTPGIPGAAVSYMFGKTPGGRKPTLGNIAYEQLAPLGLQEPIDVLAGGGTPGQAVLAAGPAQLGATVRELQPKTRTPNYLKVKPPRPQRPERY